MKNIREIVNENRKEAYELVKARGGRIDFVEGIVKGSTDDSEDDWLGDPYDEDIPFVILSADTLGSFAYIDTAVLAVKVCEDKEDIMFLGYDCADGCCSGWHTIGECAYETDNEIYLGVEAEIEFQIWLAANK